ncbi:MAG: ribosome-associated translation inhibitor RaiA [Candidatus Paceibacterota bacterium]|jgi:ribosomal subunit interface protein
MKINIKVTNITLTPAISEYADKRLQKFNSLLGNDPTALCDVELAKTTEHHQKGEIFKAEIHIVAVGKNAYVSSERSDLYTAIDMAQEEMMNELRVVKSKKVSLLRRSGAKMKGFVKGLWPWGDKA